MHGTRRNTANPQSAVATNSVHSLPAYSMTLDPDELVSRAVDELNKDPELPGIIVESRTAGARVLSRTRLFETLSRPYGLAVFLNRSIAELLDESPSPLVLESDTEIGTAVRSAMKREPASRYEPIVIRCPSGEIRLVDLRTLLLAQTELLTNSASIVTRQAELARALSGTLELDSVLSMVLDSIGELIPYERAIVYMADDGGLTKAAERNNASHTASAAPVNPPDVLSTNDARQDDNGWATFPLSRGENILGYLCIKRYPEATQDDWRSLVSSFAASAALAIANARMYAHLEEIASLDQLTGVLNRRAFMREAARSAERASRDGSPIAVIMLDLDRFKRVNDAYGHGAGDQVLKATMARALSELRGGDIACRFGGEEFVFLLHDVDAVSAGAAAERIRSRISATPIPFKSESLTVTASLGIASAVPSNDSTLEMLIDAADAAMYKAKRAGRNRIRFANALNQKNAFNELHTTRVSNPKPQCANPSADSTASFLRSIPSLLQSISLGLPFGEFSSIALDAIESILPASGLAILIRSSDGDFLRVVAQRKMPEVMVGTKVDIGYSLAGRATLERRMMSVPRNEIAASAGNLASMMEAQGYTHYRAYPLPAPSSAIGVLEVFDNPQGNASTQLGLSALAAILGSAAAIASVLDTTRQATKQLAASYDETLESWVRMLELRDQETEGHSRRVSAMTLELGEALGVSADLMGDIRRGALLHDIGKMGVPDSILLKPGQLTEMEKATIQLHPGYAHEVIQGVPFLRKAVDIPYCHHERWDGAGYPRGLAGTDIPLAARIFSVVDVWDALTSDRPYRRSLGPEESAAIIAAGAGSQFDPDVVAAFLSLKRGEITACSNPQGLPSALRIPA